MSTKHSGGTQASLFDRIGGRKGLEQIVPTVVQKHVDNPVVGHRFLAARMPIDELIRSAIEFFVTGLSGELTYKGLPMPQAHAGMGITHAEYVAVLDDILAALRQHKIGEQEQAELLFIAYGMKDEIIGDVSTPYVNKGNPEAQNKHAQAHKVCSRSLAEAVGFSSFFITFVSLTVVDFVCAAVNACG